MSTETETRSSSASAASNISLELLKIGIISGTASQRKNLSSQNAMRFRRKTASWLDDCYFRILSRCGAQSFIECGAHEASASIRFMRGGGERAIAIEANPTTFANKTVHATQFGVTALNIGLGAKAGEAEFFIPKSDSTAGNASFLPKPDEEYNTRRVPVETLSSLTQRDIPKGSKVALWIDVEGMSLEVLRGGEALLSQQDCCAIKIEVENREFWRGQALVNEINEYLSHFDFTPVLRDMEYSNQYNIVYVKKPLLGFIEETLIECWLDLANVQLRYHERLPSLMEFLHDTKIGLIGVDSPLRAKIVNCIASLFGSKSSRTALKRSHRPPP